MRITSRRGTIVFFLCLGIGLVALAVALNVGWIILNWREGVLLFFGIIFFALIIAGMVVNTIFLVREIAAQRAARQLHQRRYSRTEDAGRFDPPASGNLAAPRPAGNAEAGVLPADAERYRPAHRDGGAGAARGTRRRQESRAGKSGGRLRANWCASAWTPRARGIICSRRPPLRGSVEQWKRRCGCGAAPRISAPRFSMCSTMPSSIPANSVDVRVLLEAPDEKRIVLRVQDQGVGIPPDDMKSIFKRFYRVTTARWRT